MTLSSLFIKKIIETQKNKNNFLQRFKMGKSNLFLNSEISCTFCTIFHDYTGTCCLQCKIFVCLYLATFFIMTRAFQRGTLRLFVILVGLNLRYVEPKVLINI